MKATLALTSTLILCIALAPAAAAETVDREFHESFEVTPGARLDLIHGDGNVTIESWDKDLIDVHVLYRAEFKRKGIGSDLDLEIEFDQNGNTVRVHGREVGNKGIGFFMRRVHEYTYVIRAPADTVLDTSGDDGNLTIGGWLGEIGCRLDDGDIKLSDIETEAVRIEMQDGDLDIEGFTGALDIRMDDGDIAITDCDSPDLVIRAQDGNVTLDRCSGRFEITLDDGNLEVERAHVSKLHVRTQDGNIGLDLASATDLDLEAQADDGRVSIQLAEGISAAFTIETDHGSIDVSPDSVRTESENRMTGRIGDGNGRIRVVTDDGSVSLR